MVAYKASQVARFLLSPSDRAEGFLIYGTDDGQVSARVAALAAKLSSASDPAGDIIRLTDQDLAASPRRLSTEAQTLPMFGGRKVIISKAGPHLPPAEIEELLAGPPLPSHVIIEAGNLARDAKLRKLFEGAERAAALPCYGDDQPPAVLIREAMAAAGLSITKEAQQQLVTLLGHDQGLSRAELDKLVLYAGDDGEVTLAHVDAIVGDASAYAVDSAIAAAFAGDPVRSVQQLDRLLDAGRAPAQLLHLLGLHLLRLHRVRSAMDGGARFDAAVRQLRPPLHFKQLDAFRVQCSAWSAAGLAAAIAAVQDAVRRSRLHPALDRELAAQALMRIAARAGRGA